jgi:hypothetical protein
MCALALLASVHDAGNLHQADLRSVRFARDRIVCLDGRNDKEIWTFDPAAGMSGPVRDREVRRIGAMDAKSMCCSL